ncbi:MAG: hypothetical protein KA369_12535 [Spirochaetes bacterium]|nr:hypothetical protein [Spirochaetota bacterium]
MTRAGKSIFYFGFWVLACGISLMFFPQFSLGIAGMSLNDYLMVRLFGMILIYLGVYYFVAGTHPAFRPLYRATVFTRSLALLIMIAFVLLGMAKPIVIGFTAVDALGALWTALALRADGKDARA